MSITHQAIKESLFASPSGVARAVTHAILAKEKSCTIYEGNKVDTVTGFDEQDAKQQNTNPYNVFNFTLNTCGSGVAGTPPEIDDILKAAGGVSTVVTGTSVTYTKNPVQSNIPTVDLAISQMEVKSGQDYWYEAPNAKGNIGLSFSTDGTVDINGDNFIGDYVRPVEASSLAPDFGTQQTRIALPANADNILVAKVNNVAICLSEFSVNSLWYAGGIVRESLAGGCKTTNHEDAINDGSATIKETDWATMNLFELQDEETVVPLEVVIGSEAGKMITVSCPRVQIIGVQKATIGKNSAKSFTPRFLAPLELKFH